MTRVLGAVLAGGQARRFGSDKALARLHGVPLIERAIAALERQVAQVAVCGREWPGRIALADRPPGGHGPLAGLAAALAWGRDAGFDAVLSAPCDAADLPADLLRRLGRAPACLAQLPVVGLWPCALADAADAQLAAGERAMHAFATRVGAAPRRLDRNLANVNTPADLARLETQGG